MKYQTVLWDLDGTLINSEEGVIRCVEYALNKMGVSVPDRSVLRRFIGPPLQNGFEEICGFSAEQAARAVCYYRERYRTVGVGECYLYEGIATLLPTLKQAGITVGLATSKPLEFARVILEKEKIARWFDVVAGSDIGGAVVSKTDVLRRALSLLSPAQREQAVLVGDRCFDVEGAAAVGLPCIGVLYGFGTEEEFSGAVQVVPTVAALQDYLLGT